MLKRLQGNLRLNLGIPYLIQEWKTMFRPQTLGADIAAGLSVACVAIPLSLAIALASHVSAASGLVTAIVAGVVCALFGGTRLAVSGPAAAMAVIIAANVEQYGLTGLLVIGFLCGLLQFATGVLGLGKIIRYMPVSVITGFLAGIGAIIFIGQLPRALGLPPPDQSHVLAVLTHIKDLIQESQLPAVALSLGTMAITLFLPKVFPKIPASLVAILVCSIASTVLGLSVQTIGEIPRSLPLPSLPALPSEGIGNLIGAGLIVFALASIETLLSSSAVDKMKKGSKHDPDQELIGQGLGNMIVALFGGIPVTGVIARSGLNVQAGAKTRLSALVHSITLLGAVFVFAPLMGKIPVASLAGLLLAVSIKMLHPKEILQIWKTDRIEACVAIATFFGIVLMDLLKGVQAGVLLAFVMMAMRLGRGTLTSQRFNDAKWHLFSFGGSLTFMSLGKLERLQEKIKEKPLDHVLLIDLSKLTSIDHTAVEVFNHTMEALIHEDRKIVFLGLDPSLQTKLESAGASFITERTIKTESEISRFFDESGEESFARSLMVPGIQRFRREKRERYGKLFEELAETQSPKALFVTCSDSRIIPNLITSTDPGDLFTVRNVGNVIPRFELDSMPAEGAAIEYAVAVLGVKEIVICGHSNCGAVRTALSAPSLAHLPSLAQWIESCSYLRAIPFSNPDQAARTHVLYQLENLKSYPIVAEKLASGELTLHGWFYRMSDLVVEEYRPENGGFVAITQSKMEPDSSPSSVIA